MCAATAFDTPHDHWSHRLPPLRAALSPTEARENIRTIYDGIIDVRMSAEHRLEGRIVDSISIPAQLWEHGMYLPRDVAARVEITRPTPLTRRMKIYTQAFVPDVCEQFETACRLLCVCGDGRRSELAAQQLAAAGFSVDYTVVSTPGPKSLSN